MSDLQKLRALYQQGKIDQAKAGYLAFLRRHPENSEALHALALINVEQKQLPTATDYLKQAVHHQPDDPTLQLHLANILKMRGLFQEAITLLTDTVARHPEYAPALNNLGTLYYAQGQVAEAISFYQLALAQEPRYVDAYYNLGLALTQAGQLEEAAHAYQQVIAATTEHSAARYQLASIYMRQAQWELALGLFLELALIYPEHFETQVNLASCYLRQGALPEAKKYYAKALTLHPEDTQTLFNLGHIHAQQGNIAEAIHFYQRLVQLNPDDFAAHNNLGVIFFANKQRSEAIYHFQQALRIQPDNRSIAHLLKILHTDQHLLTSPPEYLKSLFDYYADHYEPHLLNILNYQVPDLLYRAFAHSRCFTDHPLAILDLGCGTGLCGAVFKRHAGQLVGVDLSSNMLAIAREKKIYDTLICEDFMTYLQKQQAAFDMLVAGDVFVYTGDLYLSFQYSKQALRTQGLFIFNIELSQQHDYALSPSGRFTHKKSYIEKIAQQQGFTIIDQQTAITRLQDSQPVSGQIYVLQAG